MQLTTRIAQGKTSDLYHLFRLFEPCFFFLFLFGFVLALLECVKHPRSSLQLNKMDRFGLSPDSIIDGVEVDYTRPLGGGADTVVYPGVWQGGPVAVKTLHRLLIDRRNLGRQDFIARFGRECERLRRLRHENVVEFKGVCRTRDGAPGLVTEKMGESLEKRYLSGELSIAEQLKIFQDIAAGLSYVHQEGVIHRDLAPKNVLLGSAKLADVGVARSIHGDAVPTMMTECPGTMAYMPPEAFTDRPQYDDHLDMFSFGVLMMAVINRREPSASLMQAERTVRMQDGTRRSIPEVERRAADFDAIPAEHPLKELIARCLSNEPSLRPSASDVCAELGRIEERIGQEGVS